MKPRFYRSVRPEGSGNVFRSMLVYALFVLIIFATDYFSGSIIRSYVRSGSASVQSLGASAYSVFDSGYFASHSSLVRENQELREELRSRIDRDALVSSLDDELALLKSALQTSENSEGRTVPVRSSLRSSPFGTFLIGAGSAEGVQIGDRVHTLQGLLLGTVVSVSNDTASVKMLFSAESEQEVVTNDIAFRAFGRGAGRARAEVNRDARISEGDVVYAPEISEAPAGVVGKVETDVSSALKVVHIHLPVELTTLRYVYVVSE